MAEKYFDAASMDGNVQYLPSFETVTFVDLAVLNIYLTRCSTLLYMLLIWVKILWNVS